jgi:transcriptional regulator with XRE-family HTH domain
MSELLKSVRLASNLSQNKLGKMSGVSNNYISEIEAGKYNPSSDVLDKLSGTLSQFIDLSYVAGLYDRKSSITILRVKQISSKEKTSGKWHGGWSQGYGYLARVEFRSKHKFLVELIQKVFGCGSITHTKYSKDPEKTCWTFMAWSDNAEQVLDKIYPYIKLKRQQCDLIFKLRELQKNNKSFRMHLTTRKLGQKTTNIVQDLNNGLSFEEVAKKHKVTTRVVYKYKSKYTEQAIQQQASLKESAHFEYSKYQEDAGRLWEEIRRLNKA